MYVRIHDLLGSRGLKAGKYHDEVQSAPDNSELHNSETADKSELRNKTRRPSDNSETRNIQVAGRNISIHFTDQIEWMMSQLVRDSERKL